MATETIKARFVQDGDVEVSNGARRVRVIRAPEIIGGQVHFRTDGTSSFLTFLVEEDVTIAARQFQWLGDNQDELLAWMTLHLRARNVADVPATFLPGGAVEFPSQDGKVVSAAPGDSIKIAVGDGPGDLRFVVVTGQDG